MKGKSSCNNFMFYEAVETNIIFIFTIRDQLKNVIDLR